MSIALTVCLSLVIVVLGAIGSVRDTRHSLLALLGTLFGATLVQLWGARWSAAVSGSIGGDQARTTFIVSCLLFLWGALLIGYGGGLLLGRSRERASFAQRSVGALLGLINGVLIVGFLLRYAIQQQEGFTALIAATPAAQIIHDWMPALLLGLAALVTLMMLVRGLAGLFARRAVPPPEAKPAATPSSSAPATPPATPADRRVDDRNVLNKVNDASRR